MVSASGGFIQLMHRASEKTQRLGVCITIGFVAWYLQCPAAKTATSVLLVLAPITGLR